MLAVAVTTGAGEAAAVAGLLLLALGEPIANTATSVQQLPQLDDVLRRVWANLEPTQNRQPRRCSGTGDPAAGTPAVEATAMGIRLDNVTAGWDAGQPVFETCEWHAESGRVGWPDRAFGVGQVNDARHLPRCLVAAGRQRCRSSTATVTG